jgi:hypothetical protein
VPPEHRHFNPINAVNILSTLVLLAAIVWVSLQLRDTRRKLRSGAVVKIPEFAATLVFALCIVAIVVFGLSALHLLWLFPLSAGIGLLMLFFRAGVNFTMVRLGLLASLKPYQEPERERR